MRAIFTRSKPKVLACSATTLGLIGAMLMAIPVPALATEEINTKAACENVTNGVPIVIKIDGETNGRAGCYKEGKFAETGDTPTVTSTGLDMTTLVFKKAYVDDKNGNQLAFDGLRGDGKKAYVDFAGQNESVKTFFEVDKTNSPVVFEYAKRDNMLEVVTDIKNNPSVKKVLDAPKFVPLTGGNADFIVHVETDRHYSVNAESDNQKVVKQTHTWVTNGDIANIAFPFKASGFDSNTDKAPKVTIKFTYWEKKTLDVLFNGDWVNSTKLRGSFPNGLKASDYYENDHSSTFKYYKKTHPYNEPFRNGADSTWKTPPRWGYTAGVNDPVDGTPSIKDGNNYYADSAFFGFGADRANDLNIPVAPDNESYRNVNTEKKAGVPYGKSAYPVVRNNAFKSGTREGANNQVSVDRELLGIYVNDQFIGAPKPRTDWSQLLDGRWAKVIHSWDEFDKFVVQPNIKANKMDNDFGDKAVYSDNPNTEFTFKGGENDGLQVKIILTGMEPTMMLNTPYFNKQTGKREYNAGKIGDEAKLFAPATGNDDKNSAANSDIPGLNFLYTYQIVLTNVKERIEIRPRFVDPSMAYTTFDKTEGIDSINFIPPKNRPSDSQTLNKEFNLDKWDIVSAWYSDKCNTTDNDTKIMVRTDCKERMRYSVIVKNGYEHPQVKVTRSYFDKASDTTVMGYEPSGDATLFNYDKDATYNTDSEKYGVVAGGKASVIPADESRAGKKFIYFTTGVPDFNYYNGAYSQPGTNTKVKSLPYSDGFRVAASATLKELPIKVDLNGGKYKDSAVATDFNDNTYNVKTTKLVQVPTDIPVKKGAIFKDYTLVGIKDGNEVDLGVNAKNLKPGASFNIADTIITEPNGDTVYDSLKLKANFADEAPAGAVDTYKVNFEYKDGETTKKTESVSFIGVKGLTAEMAELGSDWKKDTQHDKDNKKYQVTNQPAATFVLADDHTAQTVELNSVIKYPVTFKPDVKEHFTTTTDTDGNFAKVELAIEVGKDASLQADQIPAVEPTDGYYVLGWFKEGDQNATAKSKAQVQAEKLTGATTWLAKTAQKVTVTFEDPDKSGCANLTYKVPDTAKKTWSLVSGATLAAPGSVMGTDGNIAELSDKLSALAEPTDTHCTFAGWEVTPTGKDPVQVATSTSLLTHKFSPVDNVTTFTVKPKFTASPATVTFISDPAGAQFTEETRVKNKGDKLGALPELKDQTNKDKWELVKWYVQGDNNKTPVTADYVVEGDVTLVAEVKHVYTVTLKLADKTHSHFPGNKTDDITIKVVDGKTVADERGKQQPLIAEQIQPALNEDAKANYEIVGWTDESKTTGMTTADVLKKVVSKDITYTFVIRKQPILVTFYNSDKKTPVISENVGKGDQISSVADFKKELEKATIANTAPRCYYPKNITDSNDPNCTARVHGVFNNKWVDANDASKVYTQEQALALVAEKDMSFYPEMKEEESNPQGEKAHPVTFEGAEKATLEGPTRFSVTEDKQLKDEIKKLPTVKPATGYKQSEKDGEPVWIVKETTDQGVITKELKQSEMLALVSKYPLTISPKIEAKVFTVSFADDNNHKQAFLKGDEPVKVTFDTAIGKEPTSGDPLFEIEYWYLKSDPKKHIETGKLNAVKMDTEGDRVYVAHMKQLPDADGDGIPDYLDTDPKKPADKPGTDKPVPGGDTGNTGNTGNTGGSEKPGASEKPVDNEKPGQTGQATDNGNKPALSKTGSTAGNLGLAALLMVASGAVILATRRRHN